MILSLFYLFLSFVLLHGYLLGESFESYLSILVTLYLLTCTWAFPYIIKELMLSDHEVERLGLTILKGMSVVFYFLLPLPFPIRLG
jgi:hypothetical protein